MSKQCALNVDLADVWKQPTKKNFIRAIAWGTSLPQVEIYQLA
jgi:hypothetical protein